MLEDVLDAAVAALPGAVLVVTTDPEVQAVARAPGRRVPHRERQPRPHRRGGLRPAGGASPAARRASSRSRATCPASPPRRSPRCAAPSRKPPAWSSCPRAPASGTNAALLAPPDAMPLKFGEPSFANHLKTARAAGLTPRVLELPGHRPRRGRARGSARPPRARARAPGAPGSCAASRRGAAVRRGSPLAMPPRYEVIGVEGLPEIRPGDDLARPDRGRGAPPGHADRRPGPPGDQPEDRLQGRGPARAALRRRRPRPRAQAVAAEIGRDPRLVEVILGESRRIVRKDKGVLIVETHHGWVCANAGVDQSNVDADTACLLPEDSDRSARALRERLQALTGHELGRDHRRHLRPALARGPRQRRGRRRRLRAASAAISASWIPPATCCRRPSWRWPTSWPARPSRSWASSTAFRWRSSAGSTGSAGDGSSRALLRDPARDLFRYKQPAPFR